MSTQDLSKKETIHENRMCDICLNDKPIKGIRYSCLTCNDYDLCSFHYANIHKSDHDLTHRWIEFRIPGVEHSRSVHEGYKCDVCLKIPLQGIRFHCMSCQDFDCCENCYFSGNKSPMNLDHPEGHNFKPIFTPQKISVEKNTPTKKPVMRKKNPPCKKCGSRKGPIYKCDTCQNYYLCHIHVKLSKKFHMKKHVFEKIQRKKPVKKIEEEEEERNDMPPKRPLSVVLSYDVLGVIMSFSVSTRAFFGVCLTCKDVDKFLKSNPQCFEQIEFRYLKTPKTRKNMPYVSKLMVKGVILSDKAFSRFTKLRRLTLIGCTGLGIRGIVFPPHFTKCLRHIAIEGCKDTKTKEVMKLKSLRSLRVDASHIIDGFEVGAWIGQLKKLEKVHFVRVKTSSKFMFALGKIAPQIRKFVFIGQFNAPSERVFLKMTNLRELELSGGAVVAPKGLVNSQKMRSLMILHSLVGQEEYRKLPNLQNLEFIEVKKRELRRMRGSVAPRNVRNIRRN